MVAWLLLCSAAIAGERNGVATSAACKRYCLSVTPKRGDTSTVFVFRGRGWEPHKGVEAIYGRYCPPPGPCTAEAYFRHFRTNSRGSFVFRFRQGPSPLIGVPKPRGSGSNVSFEQWSGKPYRSKLVMRAVSYYVDGRLVKPPSSNGSAFGLHAH